MRGIDRALGPISEPPRGEAPATAPSTADASALPEAASSASPRAGNSTVAGLLGGLAGRLATNNLTQTAAHHQSGAPRFDRSLATARSLLIGSGVQTAVTYGVRQALEMPAEASFGKGGRVATDVFAGALGGLAMHPASVRFFLADTLAHGVGASRFPALRGMEILLRRSPSVFLRGFGTRVALSGLDWGLYFGLREELRGAVSEASHGRADSAAALGAILATTPLYRVYVHQIKTGQAFTEASRALFGSGAPRAGSPGLTAAFVGIAVLEKMVVDRTQVAVERSAWARVPRDGKDAAN